MQLLPTTSDDKNGSHSDNDQSDYNSSNDVPNGMSVIIYTYSIITILGVAIHVKVALEATASVELIEDNIITACSRSPTVTPAEAILTIFALTFTVTAAED